MPKKLTVEEDIKRLEEFGSNLKKLLKRKNVSPILKVRSEVFLCLKGFSGISPSRECLYCSMNFSGPWECPF